MYLSLTAECEVSTSSHKERLGNVRPFGRISDTLHVSGVCVILIQYWDPESPAGFSTKQGLRQIQMLFLYHLSKCQRSASGQMEAEQIEL